MARKSISTESVATFATEPVETTSTGPTEVPTEDGYEFNASTVVEDYKNGRVTKRDAKKTIEGFMFEAITAGNLLEAQSWSKLLKEVDGATRSAAKGSAAEVDPSEYVQAILARVGALKAMADQLLTSVIVPSDVPSNIRDDVKSILEAHLAGQVTIDVSNDQLDAAIEPVKSLSQSRVIGNNSLQSHLNDIIAGKATSPNGFPFTLVKNQTYRIAEISGLRTPTYPKGPSTGLVNSRFNHGIAERFPVGWVAADAKGLHGTESVAGCRYVGDIEIVEAPEQD